jgi:D-aminopeptidase
VLADPVFALMQLGTLAATVVARAIARGVYEAAPLPLTGALPSYRDKLGK